MSAVDVSIEALAWLTVTLVSIIMCGAIMYLAQPRKAWWVAMVGCVFVGLIGAVMSALEFGSTLA